MRFLTLCPQSYPLECPRTRKRVQTSSRSSALWLSLDSDLPVGGRNGLHRATSSAPPKDIESLQQQSSTSPPEYFLVTVVQTERKTLWTTEWSTWKHQAGWKKPTLVHSYEFRLRHTRRKHHLYEMIRAWDAAEIKVEYQVGDMESVKQYDIIIATYRHFFFFFVLPSHQVFHPEGEWAAWFNDIWNRPVCSIGRAPTVVLFVFTTCNTPSTYNTDAGDV